MDNSLSLLDHIWRQNGAGRLQKFFLVTARQNTSRALRLINNENVSFPVLFLLTDDIVTLDLFRQLSLRNKTAIRLCVYMAMKRVRSGCSWEASDDDALQRTLRWMLSSGKNWDGPYEGRDDYDAVLDYAAALLTVTYDDTSVLPDIADLIFRRNRKEFYIHDLVWSLFQTFDEKALKLVALRLKSADLHDIELAGKLLQLDIPVPPDRRKLVALYEQYIRWLEENRPYLYLTGEHFQMTNSPVHLDFDREAKYLHKAISPRLRTPDMPLTDNEIDCLNRFRQSPEDEREMLAAYSEKLWSEDKGRWDDWIHGQISEQVFAARKALGDSDAYY